MTRQDYMDGKITHTEYYRTIAQEAGVNFAGCSIINQVKIALAIGDEYLNTIPLGIWDMYSLLAQRATSAVFERHGDHWSLCGGVCVAKQAAQDAAWTCDLCGKSDCSGEHFGEGFQ